MEGGAQRPRPRVPRRITVYVSGATLATIGVLGWTTVHSARPTPTQAALTGVLTLMIGVAHLYPLQLAPRTKVSVDTAPAFAAAVLLPTPLAMLASLSGIGTGEIIRHTAPVQVAYNTAVAGLRAGAAAAVFGRLAAGPLTATLSGERAVAALTAAAVTMFTVNATLIDLIIGIQQRRNPLRGWWQRRRRHLAHEVTLYLLGALAAVSGARWPAAVLLLTAPSVVVYRSLRDGVAVRVQTRAGLLTIADAVDARDRTPGHSERVAELARRLALHLHLPAHEVELIALAARMHDIGNLGLRSTIFTKPGPLSPVEWREVRTHPEAGARLLRGLPELAAAAPLVLSHHERWDGRGYPQGLQGEAIPLGARIIAVAEAFDAMTSERPYRRALPPAIVRAELEEGRGTQFDPRVVDALIDLLTREPQLAHDAAPPGR